jgi:hypothetical protein
MSENRKRQQPPPTERPQQQAPQRPAPDPKAQKWAEKNEWFGKEKTRTFATYAIHQDLVDEGFDTKGDEYYDELNSRLRAEFPHKFGAQQNQPNRGNVQTVAGASRQAPSGQNKVRGNKRTVRLTPGQQAAAKELGVSLEEYAKYVN